MEMGRKRWSGGEGREGERENKIFFLSLGAIGSIETWVV